MLMNKRFNVIEDIYMHLRNLVFSPIFCSNLYLYLRIHLNNNKKYVSLVYWEEGEGRRTRYGGEELGESSYWRVIKSPAKGTGVSTGAVDSTDILPRENESQEWIGLVAVVRHTELRYTWGYVCMSLCMYVYLYVCLFVCVYVCVPCFFVCFAIDNLLLL